MLYTEQFMVPHSVLVNTMHVLSSGEIVESREGFEKVQDRFSWVDRTNCIQRIIKLRSMTDEGRKSIIVFYEDGHLVKEHINVDHQFKPLAFA